MLGTRAFVPMTSARAEPTLQPAIRLGGLTPPVTAALRPMPVIAIPEARPALRLEFVLLAIPLAALAVLALLPGLLGPSLDAAVFSVVGERLATGELPYAQVFDHKPPGLYLLIGLGDLLGGPLGAWRVSWLISAAAAALTGVLVADTLRLLGWRRLAWLCGGLCTALLASFPLALGGGLGETVAVLPAAAAVRLGAAGSIRLAAFVRHWRPCRRGGRDLAPGRPGPPRRAGHRSPELRSRPPFERRSGSSAWHGSAWAPPASCRRW